MVESDSFVELVDEARHQEATLARTRRRWLDQQVLDEGGFVGTLLDLAETGRVVLVHTESGRTHQGYVGEVGDDHCFLETTAGVPVLVAIDAISSVRPRTPVDRVRAVGDRRPASHRSLRDQLQRIAWNGPRVIVTTRGSSEVLAGELVSVGQDVLTLELAGEAAGSCFVRVDAVAEVTVVDGFP